VTDIPAQEILQVAQRYGATSVRVFGSHARGQARPDSDLDLLVEVDESATLFSLLSMEHELEQLLGIPVEVLTAEDIHPLDRDQVLREAEPLVA
jgi:uncharacterized protein